MITTSKVFRLVCDECHAQGPEAGSKSDAIRLALNMNFQHKYIGPGETDAIYRDRCENCRRRALAESDGAQ